MTLPKTRRVLSLIALLSLFVTTLPGCTVNPATGQSTFTGLMSESEEQRIGRDSHPKVLTAFGGAYEDVELQRYIDSIGQLLARASDRPDQRYIFTVLDSPIVNAFAVPGGYIYLTRGLLALANDESEIAGVLAHEIGHIAARHSAERYSQAGIASILAATVGIATGSGQLANAAGSGAAVYLQSYSRDQENQADLLGIRYLSRTGYDPYGMVDFLRQLEADDRLDATIAGRPEMADGYSIMSTHPRTSDRIRQTIQQAGAAQVPNPLVERELYLSKINGMLYGDEPEQGYIRGRQFLHPTLHFRFEVPPGFHMINTADAVIARRADGATIDFSAAKQASNASMYDYLVGEWAPNLALTDAETIDVNGMAAATGSDRVETRSGSRDFRLVAIRYDDNNVYRFLFIIKPEITQQLGRDLRETTYSFSRLSKREAAALRPQRVDVVSALPGETIEELAAKMPFESYQTERFRVLNGLAPGDRLAPGQLVKIIAE
ncbi:MAG: M48 family metalloprotease [Dongiaceae bacterium]